MNRSNGGSRMATKTSASNVESKATMKSDADRVVVSFDSDNESSGDDGNSEEEEEEGRSSSASSAPAESEGDPSSNEEDASADEAEKGDADEESKNAEKDDAAENVTYKLTLEPSTGDVEDEDEKNEEENESAKNSDDEDEDGGDGSAEVSSEEEDNYHRGDTDTKKDAAENVTSKLALKQSTGDVDDVEEENEEDNESAKNSDDEDKDGSAEVSEEEKDHKEDSDKVSKRLDVKEEADDEDETRNASAAEDSEVDAIVRVPEPPHVPHVKAPDIPGKSTHDPLTLTHDVAEITTTLKSASEQPPLTASAADGADDHQTVDLKAAGGIEPPINLSGSSEEDKKQKKKAKKKRHIDAGDKVAKGDELTNNVVREDSQPDDHQTQPIDFTISGGKIDKLDLLPTVADDRKGQDDVTSEVVQSGFAAGSLEPTSSTTVVQSVPLDNADITSNLPTPPKEKKKKKHAAPPLASVNDVDVAESTTDGSQQKYDTVVTAIIESHNAGVTGDVDPAKAVTVDITETARDKLEPALDEKLLTAGETTAAAAPGVEDEKEGKKKKKKKKSTDQTNADQPPTTAGTGNTNGDLVNEEPSQGVRRNSIDEFIRRILAEAREEQKKRTEDIKSSSANDQPTSVAVSSELSQKQLTVARSREQPDVVQSVNGDAGKKDDGTGFVRIAASTSVIADNQVSADNLSDSMLDRRLASTERKREQEVSANLVLTELVDRADITKAYPKPATSSAPAKTSSALPDLEAKAQPIRNGISGYNGVEDIDQELADISRIFSKRAPLNLDNGIDDDDESTAVDGASGWLRSRPRVNGQTNGTSVENDVDDDNDAASGVLSSARRFSAQFGLAGIEEFIPARRPETDEIIRSHMRPVRAVIEQQADVIQKLKSVGRDIAQLDDEIRDIRQSCIVDRRTAVDSMLIAVAEEMRLYEAEQRAADERVMRQLAIVRFVREQFVAAVMSPAVNVSRTRGDIFDRITAAAGGGLAELSFVKPPSQLGYRGGGSSLELPTPKFSRRAQSVAPGGAGDFLDTGRIQRGGSVARDSSLQRGDAAENIGDESSAIWKRSPASISATQWSQTSGNNTFESSDGDRRSRLLRAGSVGPSWYSASSFDLPPPSSSQRTNESTDSSESGRRRLTTFPSIDAYSSSGEDSTPSYRYSSYRSSNDYSSDQLPDYRRGASGSSGYASSFSSLEESSSDSSSRYARRFSVADATNSRYSDRYSSRGSYGDSSTYASGGYVSRLGGGSSTASGSGSEFQSKFLDKVRERKAKAAIGVDSPTTTASTATTSSTSSGVDKPFKSRFLKSSFESDPPPTRRYSSTSYD